MVSGNFERVGLEALIVGAAQYLQDAASINAATAALVGGIGQHVPAATREAAGGMGLLTTGMNAATGAAGQLTGGFSAMLGPFSGLAREGVQVTSEMAAVATESSSLTGVLLGMTGVVAAVAGAFGGLALEGEQWADEMMRITSITGLSQDQAELYSHALADVGGSGQSLIRTTFMLERQLQAAAAQMAAGEEPTGRVAMAMKSLGIQFADNNGEVRDMGQLLPELFSKLGTMTNAQERNALASQLFGRYGIEVTRMLANWSTVMPLAQQQTEEFNRSQVNATMLAIGFHSAMETLRNAFQQLGIMVLPQFIEIAQRVATSISQWVQAHGEDFVRNLGVVVSATVSVVEHFATVLSEIPPWLLKAAVESAGAAVGVKLLGVAAEGATHGWSNFNQVLQDFSNLSQSGFGLVALAQNIGRVGAALQAAAGALFLTPIGWAAIAVAVATAGAGYLIVQNHIAATAETQARLDSLNKEAAEAIKGKSAAEALAHIKTLEFKRTELQAELALLAARTPKDSAEEAEIGRKMAIVSGALAEVEGRLGAVIPLWQDLAIGESKTADTAAAVAAEHLAVANALTAAAQAAGPAHAALLAIDSSSIAAKGGLTGLSAGAQVLANDLAGLTADALATRIVLEEMANTKLSLKDILNTPFLVDAMKRQFASAGEQLKLIQSWKDEIGLGATAINHAAGIVTDADKRMADSAQRAAEARAAAAAKMMKDAQDAAKAIALAEIGQLDQLGALVVDALRAQHAEELRVTEESIASQRALIDQVYAERIDAAHRASDAEIASIDAVTAAMVAGLNAQIGALQAATTAEDRQAIVRKIALTYDAKEHAAAEKELRDFDRRTQENTLRSQIATVEESARVSKDAVKTQLDERLNAIDKEQKMANAALNRAEKSAQEMYQKQTFDFALQAEARVLLMNAEQTRYVQDLLTKYAPQWATAGISFGAQLVNGIRSQIEPYLRSLQNLIPYGGGPSAASQSRASYVSGLQQQGAAAAAGGAPDVALEQMRQSVVAAGESPNFDTGLGRGPVGRSGLATLAKGEVVLTLEQQRQYLGAPFSPATSGYSIPAREPAMAMASDGGGGGVVFERGAFDGMLSGATFGGDVRDNARAIVDAFERLMGQQLGRGAFLSGSGR